MRLGILGKFSAALPAEVSDLFKVDGIESQFRKSDNVFIKSENVSSNMIFVSPSEKYKSIEKLLEVDFIDEEAEDFTVFLKINIYMRTCLMARLKKK